LSVNPCMLHVHYSLVSVPLCSTTQTYWSQLDVRKSRKLLAAKYLKTEWNMTVSLYVPRIIILLLLLFTSPSLA
jgi:hypothetical protein